MEFKKLAFEILSNLKENRSISSVLYPKDLYFNSSEVNNFKQINNYSNRESLFFPKKSGSIGYEYAIQLLYFIDEVYSSNPITGNYSSVNVRGSFSATSKYIEENKKIIFNLEFGEKKIETKSYKTESLDKNILYGIVATIHTHPKFYHTASSFQYSFFSPQDISTLIYGNIPILGLIAGNDLWLACKTSTSEVIKQDLLNEASRIELNKGSKAVKEFVKNELKNFNIVFYCGSLGGMLNKI